jgi:ribosomal protein S18 acetylase RimI-like enzyme
VIVRALDPARDTTWAERFLDERLGGRSQARRGELVDVLAFPGLVAEVDDEPVGLLTYHLREGECEIAAIAASARQCGVGTALIEALRSRIAERIWLVTTNDNIDALRFYQRRGFRLRALHPGAVEAARKLKPQIGATGEYGIPRRDELELELAD